VDISHNVLGWFEIPVQDIDRAVAFYEAVFGFPLTRQKLGSLDMALSPRVDSSIGPAGTLALGHGSVSIYSVALHY
jgi:predicted enzyme related to lactoylglutathione lyase